MAFLHWLILSYDTCRFSCSDYRLHYGASIVVRPRPFSVPIQTTRVGDRRRRLDVESAKDLLDRAFDPVKENECQQSSPNDVIYEQDNNTHFLPLTVAGISGVSSTIPGTCLALNSFLITALMR